MEEDMIVVLKSLVRFIHGSASADFGSENTEEILILLKENILSLEKTGYLSSPERIIDLFSNVSNLQEVAKYNGWESECLELVKQFQSSIDKCW